MSTEDARLAGIVPPLGHHVPKAPPRDVLFTPFRLARTALRIALRLRTLRRNPLGSPEIRAVMMELLELLGIRLTMWGMDRLLPGGQLLMWNQTSHLDHFVLGAVIPVPFRSLYNIEVARIPFYRSWLERNGHYLVDRFDEAQWRRSIEQAAAWMREGNTMLVSPEGTRSWDGHILPMKRGAMWLARTARLPVVPVVIYGARDALPRGRFSIVPGQVEAEIRPPIPTEPLASETVGRLEQVIADAFRQALAEGPPSLRKGALPPASAPNC